MSWVITPSALLVDDPDAMTYLAAVEAADGQALEPATRRAVNAFIKGCKADGLWPAIKASCILAGARTLSGALVPLVGTAPTNFNFVSGDYDRKTGLKGNGTTKYLNSGVSTGTDLSNHVSAYIGSDVATTSRIIGADSSATGRIELSWSASSTLTIAIQNLGGDFNRSHARQLGFVGASANYNTGTITTRGGGTTVSGGSYSFLSLVSPITIFRYLGLNQYYSGRIAFYSIGQTIDLALLDARVTALINAFAAAIP